MSTHTSKVAALEKSFCGSTKRCTVCEVTRPIEFFSSNNDKRPGKTAAPRSMCRSCNRAPKDGSPRALKRAGAPIAKVQLASNQIMDRIRRKDGLPEFSYIEHVGIKSGYSEREHLPDERRQEIINRTADVHVLRSEALALSSMHPRAARRRVARTERKETDATEKQRQHAARKARLARRHAAMSEEELVVAAVRKAIRTSAGAKSRVRANNLAIDENRPISVPTRPPSKRKKWTLTPRQLGKLLKESQMKCAVSGVRFEMAGADIWRPRHPLSPSLDQVRPGKGYTFGNAQLVCWIFNAAKNDQPLNSAIEAFLAVAEGLRARCQ